MKRLLFLVLLACASAAIYYQWKNIAGDADLDPEIRPGLGAPPIEIKSE